MEYNKTEDESLHFILKAEGDFHFYIMQLPW